MDLIKVGEKLYSCELSLAEIKIIAYCMHHSGFPNWATEHGEGYERYRQLKVAFKELIEGVK